MEGTAPPIVHECAACGHLMQVPGRYTGSEQRCRRCGEPFLVAGPEPTAGATVEEATGRGGWRRVAWGCAAAVAGGALLLVAAWLLQPVLAGPPTASDLVRESLAPTVMPVKWSQAPLAGGTAVVLNDIAAYWVHQGVVHACNGNAREWSPGASQAPPEIDELAVRRAVLNPGRPEDAVR